MSQTLHVCRHISVSLAVKHAGYHGDSRLDARAFVPLKGGSRIKKKDACLLKLSSSQCQAFSPFFFLVIKQLREEEFRENAVAESRGALTLTWCSSENAKPFLLQSRQMFSARSSANVLTKPKFLPLKQPVASLSQGHLVHTESNVNTNAWTLAVWV